MVQPPKPKPSKRKTAVGENELDALPKKPLRSSKALDAARARERARQRSGSDD